MDGSPWRQQLLLLLLTYSLAGVFTVPSEVNLLLPYTKPGLYLPPPSSSLLQVTCCITGVRGWIQKSSMSKTQIGARNGFRK
jgi:hypothetical protein